MGQSESRSAPRKTRRDGWTAARQIGFLDALTRTRSVTRAAHSVGMSREGAYRFRVRTAGGLFAILWDRLLLGALPAFESHGRPLGDGRVARLLGNHYRRQSGEFARIGPGAKASQPK